MISSGLAALALDPAERLQHQLLFFAHRAAGDDHRTARRHPEVAQHAVLRRGRRASARPACSSESNFRLPVTDDASRDRRRCR